MIAASRRILACHDTLVAGLVTRPGSAHGGVVGPGEPSCVDRRGLPVGIKVMEWSAASRMAMPLRVTGLDALHRQALTMAWRDGAWDIKVDLFGPLDGPALGLVAAFTDWSTDPGLEDILLEAGRRGQLVGWFWFPLLDGPPQRRQLHAAKDVTLGPGGGRDGEPPAAILDRHPTPRSRLIRLGTWSEAHKPKLRPRPATPRQRSHIVALRLRQGERGFDLPRRLPFDEASAWIDRLLGAP